MSKGFSDIMPFLSDTTSWYIYYITLAICGVATLYVLWELGSILKGVMKDGRVGRRR